MSGAGEAQGRKAAAVNNVSPTRSASAIARSLKARSASAIARSLKKWRSHQEMTRRTFLAAIGAATLSPLACS